MWAQAEDKEFWLSWLNRYRALKCLWDDEAKRTAGKSTRYAAYLELAELAKTVNVNADVAFVRGRINAFRTCFRRELRKVQVAKANGCIYEPQLFYYHALDFLSDDKSDMCDMKYEDEFCVFNESEADSVEIAQEVSKLEKVPQTSTDKNAAIKKKITDCLSAHDTCQASAAKRKFSSTGATDSIGCEEFDTQQSVHNMATTQHENESDEYDILGKRIAAHFRNMTSQQSLIAEKIITDVCIYGRMEKLTMDSTFIIESTRPKDDETQQEVDYDNPDTFIYT